MNCRCLRTFFADEFLLSLFRSTTTSMPSRSSSQSTASEEFCFFSLHFPPSSPSLEPLLFSTHAFMHDRLVCCPSEKARASNAANARTAPRSTAVWRRPRSCPRSEQLDTCAVSTAAAACCHNTGWMTLMECVCIRYESWFVCAIVCCVAAASVSCVCT